MSSFDRIYEVVRAIPRGRVMSYGQIADEAGTTPRVVGFAVANPPVEDLPWHRVIGSNGGLPIGRRSEELAARQRALLEAEGVRFRDGRVEKSAFGG